MSKAALEINEAISQIAKKYDLSLIEEQKVLIESILRLNNYLLRYERHKNYETPSGEFGE